MLFLLQGKEIMVLTSFLENFICLFLFRIWVRMAQMDTLQEDAYTLLPWWAGVTASSCRALVATEVLPTLHRALN